MRAARRVLERLEETLRTAVESVGRLLPGKLEPLELATELRHAMDQSQRAATDGTFAANEYRVLVSAEDLELLGGLVAELESELARDLIDYAQDREYLIGPGLGVKLEADERLGGGRVRVEAQFVDRPVPARLEVISGMASRVYEFTGEADLGRSEDCRIALDEAAISRQHARISWTYPGYVLEDLGSSNGTFVNGHKTGRILLQSGDILEIGLVQLRFSYPRE